MINLELLTADLIRHEGLKLKPYRCTAGKLTLGVGRNLEDVGITREEALSLLANDLARVTRELDVAHPWWRKLDEPRARALVNLTFNVGINRLAGFKKFLAALERGDYVTAGAEMLDSKWAGQVGGRATELAELVSG